MDFTMPPEFEELRRSLRGFVERHLRPIEQKVEDADAVDPDEMAALRRLSIEQGFYAYNVAESAGGGGLSALGQVVLAEETGRTTMAMSRAIGYLPSIVALAQGAQRDGFMRPVVAGERLMAYAVTEPDAGSDMGGLRTHARRHNGGWVLNGSKQFVGSVRHADFIVVAAVTDAKAPLRDRFTLFIVDRANPGFHYTRAIPKMGWRGSDYSAFSLDDCLVEDDAVLGGVGGGFAAIMGTINQTRVHLCGLYNGMAQDLLERGIAYAKMRRTFGKPLGEHQAIGFKLANIDCELAASRLLAYQAAVEVDSGAVDARIAASRAKYYASEMVGRAADQVLQIFGAAGYSKDLPIERMYRDARAFRIGEGSSEMQLIQIARHLLR